jgi:hypothetical protein
MGERFNYRDLGLVNTSGMFIRVIEGDYAIYRL